MGRQMKRKDIFRGAHSGIEEFQISFFINLIEKENCYKVRLENLIQLLLQINFQKSMISQTNQLTALKPYQNDYTNVSSSNNDKHPVDSSLQEKSIPQQSPYHPPNQNYSSIDPDDLNFDDSPNKNEKIFKANYFKKSIQWMGKRYKRFKLKVQTLYLAISYLIKYIGLVDEIKHKYEILSAICMLLASKVNQICFPSIKSIIGAVDFPVTKKQILQAQQVILEELGFQVEFDRNSYSIVYEYFAEESQEKKKNAEKLLFLSISNPQTLQFGQIYLGMSIVYLLKPQALKNNMSINRDKMKKIALIVYDIYKEKKSLLSNKENSAC